MASEEVVYGKFSQLTTCHKVCNSVSSWLSQVLLILQ